MPTASDELRGLMEKWFGDGISECGPINFLESRGYVLRRDWFWEKPVPSHTISIEELQCLIFLVDEWDFGGVRDGPTLQPIAATLIIAEDPPESGDDAFISHI